MAYPPPFPYPVATPAQEPSLQPAMQLPPQAATAAGTEGPFHVAYTSGYTASYANANPRGPPTGGYPGFFSGAGGGRGAPYGASPFAVPGAGPGPGGVPGIAAAPAPAGTVPPGTGTYFATPHMGGFYTDPLTEQKRQQQMHLLQQHMHQTMQQQQTQADGRLYNGWAGVPDEESKGGEDENDRDGKEKKHKLRAKTAASDKKKDRKDKRAERHAASKNKYDGADPTGAFPVLAQTEPTRHAKDGKKQRQSRHQRRRGRAGILGYDGGAGDSEDEDNMDDFSSLCGSESDSDSSVSPSRAGYARFKARRMRFAPVCDVPVYLGGSGRVVMHCVGGTQPDTDDQPRRRRRRHQRDRRHDSADSDTDTGTDTELSSPSLRPSPPPTRTAHTATGDAAAVPAITSFTVSARRMRQTAKNWTKICRPGVDTFDTTMVDPAAVLGMYRMLEVLHTGVPPGRAASAAVSEERPMKGYTASSSSSSSSPPFALSASPSPTLAQGPFRPLSPTPVVLPPRVLAYVVLFGLEFGALEPASGIPGMPDDTKPQKQQQANTLPSFLLMSKSASTSAPASRQPPPLPNLLRARTVAWLDAFAYSVGSSSGGINDGKGNNTTAKGTVPPPRSDRPSPLARDWPYVLYVARVLGHRALFGACVRLLLEQWGPLVEAAEAAALLAALPPAMQATVQRDMGCLRAARMRSVESIVNAAMHTFPPPSL